MSRIDYSDCSIKEFMDAWFKKKRNFLNDEDFEHIYIQYIDASGLFITKEFELLSYIHYINNRITSISLSIKLQRDFIDNFGLPFLPGLSFFKKFGHSISFDPKKSDIDSFLESLRKIESKESKYQITLQVKTEELLKLKDKREDVSAIQSRHSFIKMLQNLERIGYKIDRNLTSVEDLSLMIKEAQEETQKRKQDEWDRQKRR